MIKTVKKPLAQKELSKKKPAERKDLLAIVDSINKDYGHNAIVLGVKSSKKEKSLYEQDFISTGLLQLDADLGGGVPVGRYLEISGAESSTKTTLSLHILANAQKKGMLCALLDVEGTSGDRDYLESCGVDADSILYSRPSSLEEATNLIDTLQREQGVKFIIWDSIAMSMATRKELDTEVGDSMRMGIPQSEIAQCLRSFQMANNLFFRTGQVPTTLIGINQLREKIGAYGDPEYTPGGRAKDFVSSINLRLRKGDWIKEGNEIIGQVMKYKVSKNKIYKRGGVGEVDFYFADNSIGIEPCNYDVLQDVSLIALSMNVIHKAGGWFSYKDVKVQGGSKLIEAMRSNPSMVEEIRAEVMQIVKEKREQPV